MTAPCHVAVSSVVAIACRNASTPVKAVVAVGLVGAHFLEDCLPHWHYFQSVSSICFASYSLLSTVIEIVVALAVFLTVWRASGLKLSYLGVFALCGILLDLLNSFHFPLLDSWDCWAWSVSSRTPDQEAMMFELLWSILLVQFLRVAVFRARCNS